MAILKKLKIIKKRWYLLTLLILSITVFFYQRSASQAKIQLEKTTYTVKKQTLKETLSLSGQIQAQEKVTLRFQTSGRLAWVGVKEGDFVKKYQAIASLDQRDVQKNLEKSLRDYAKVRWDFEEDKEVTYKNSIKTDTIRRILEKNQFDLEKAVLDVELRQLAIEYSTLITPIEGIVTRIGNPYAGVNITPAQAEFEIINPKTVYFSASADQTDVIKLKNGKNAVVILDAYPDESIKAKITSISFIPKEGETGTVYEIKLDLDKTNDDYHFRQGMTGDANFVIKERKNVLHIPSFYIKSEKGKKYVWKLENGRRIKTFVTVGEEIDSSTQIIKGLSENDVIQN